MVESTRSNHTAKRISIRVSALLWADILVGYILFEMQDYLTEVWGLSFTHAAGILNISNGISFMLQPLFLLLIGRFLRNFDMLVISSSAYTLGICFLFMSAPPVLANSTGTCKELKQECIGDAQKTLFYIGMALIGVGAAGNNVSVYLFGKEQEARPENSTMVLKPVGMAMVVIVGVVGAIVLSFIKQWNYRFLIPAVCTTVAWVSFFTGLCCSEYLRPKERPVLNFSGRLTFRMALTFVSCGIVSSAGNTYFVEQAKHLSRNLGGWKVPAQVLMLVQALSGKLLALLADALTCQEGEARFLTGTVYGVVTAKMFAVACCAFAAGMETMRLGAVRKHGLLDSPDKDIPMRVFLLLPQFAFLGGMEPLLEKNLGVFVGGDGVAVDHKHSLKILTKGLTGIGYVAGVVLVCLVRIVTAEVSEPGWFRFTSNRSRLDLYYWVLMVLSGVSLVLFLLVRGLSRD